MAEMAVDATIAKLGTVQEVFEQIDPNVLAEYIVNRNLPRIEEYVDEVMLEIPFGRSHTRQKMLYQRVTRFCARNWSISWCGTSITRSTVFSTSKAW